MKQERPPRSIVFNSPVHASLPVVGTAIPQGPNSGPVGTEGSPTAGSRAKSLRYRRADVALGSSASSDTACELKRIEGSPDCVTRGRTSEMPEGSGTARQTTDQVSTTFITAKTCFGGCAKANGKSRSYMLMPGPHHKTPSGSGSRNGTGDVPCAICLCLCHQSLTASGPTKFTGLASTLMMEAVSAHRIWGACG